LNQFYVGLWSDEYTKHPDTIDIKFWLGMYAVVLIGTSVFYTATYGVWYIFQWLAARRLHEGLVAAVIYSPIRFFDTTPIGRVINRLSNDVRWVEDLPGVGFGNTYTSVDRWIPKLEDICSRYSTSS
jgi:ABC-type multidrug transport system fused ATPase/permease subunit